MANEVLFKKIRSLAISFLIILSTVLSGVVVFSITETSIGAIKNPSFVEVDSFPSEHGPFVCQTFKEGRNARCGASEYFSQEARWVLLIAVVTIVVIFTPSIPYWPFLACCAYVFIVTWMWFKRPFPCFGKIKTVYLYLIHVGLVAILLETGYRLLTYLNFPQ